MLKRLAEEINKDFDRSSKLLSTGNSVFTSSAMPFIYVTILSNVSTCDFCLVIII